MSRRRFVTAIGFGALALPWVALAQQVSGRTHRVGCLFAASPTAWRSRTEAFRAGMRELGYIEGKNLALEFRWADGKYEKLPDLAAELVRLKVHVLVTGGTPATLAAKKATTTIPIVMVVTGDAIATGLVASLARPGANLTGFTFFNPELAAKRLEILREILPRARMIAVVTNPDNPIDKPVKQSMDTAAKSLRLELQHHAVRAPVELDAAFAAMTSRRADAVAINDDAMLIANAKAITDLAARHRLPSIGFDAIAESGGLLAYGVNFVELYRRSAVFVDKVLRGAKPADLPVEQATRFELLLNLKSAKSLRVPITRDLLTRADRVIE